MTKQETSGVLDPEHHARLIEMLPSLCTMARVPESAVHTPLTEVCEDTEAAWVRKYHQHVDRGVYGAVYEGEHWEPDILERFQAIAGCLMRNFIDARIWMLQEVIQAQQDGEPPRFSALLIPDFYHADMGGRTMPAWQRQHLLGVLHMRQSERLLTLVGVSDMKLLEQDYGAPFARLLEKYDRFCSGGFGG